MVSRRRLLRLGAGAAAAAGCLDNSRRGDDAAVSTTATATESTRRTSEAVEPDPTTTPDDLPEWTPDWTLPFDGWQVLGLDATADDALFATLNRENGRSALAAVSLADESVRWRTEMEGEAVSGSNASSRRIARSGWGATVESHAVYAVAGMPDERTWTALHAFDRATGERRWSLERDRRLAVAGVSAGLVVATGLEFFPPPDETPTSHETPEEPLTTVVYGLDHTEGSVVWEREFTAVTDVAVSEWGVVVASEDGLVVLARDGETRFRLDAAPARRVEVAGDRLFLLSGDRDDATLHGVHANGEVRWRYEAPVEELRVAGDRLYAGGETVVALEADGTLLWRADDYGRWLLVDPDADTLYTRSGVGADAATAYASSGAKRWTFDPPSRNAWPEAATDDALAATAITADDADDLFYTVYAVDSAGEATAAVGRDTVFDAVGLDDTVYLADGRSTLLALTP